MVQRGSTKSVCLVVHKTHLVSLYGQLSETYGLIGIAARATPQLPEERFMRIWRTPLHTFGLHGLMQFLRRETQAPLYVSGLRRFLEKEMPAVVVVFDVYHWYTLQALAHKKRHPETKFVLYSETRRWPENPLSRLALRFFIGFLKGSAAYIDAILVYTPEEQAFLKNLLPGCRITVLPAPVDSVLFQPRLESKSALNDGVRILMNARFVPYKRHTDMLRALRLLADESINLRLSLIGSGGHLKDAIAAEARSLGVEDKVIFLPCVPTREMPKVYADHDILVLPTHGEAIGMVVPEAMACGLPTITSDTVGGNVYVEEGETGLIFKTGNAEHLARCIEKLADPALRKEYGLAARKRIETYFSVGVIASSFVSILDQLED